MLARPPAPEFEPAGHEPAARAREDQTSQKHSTLRPPAPPPDAAVTEVRLPPHPAPSCPSLDSGPSEDSEPPTIGEAETAERSTRPGFAFEREDDWSETLEESGLRPRPQSATLEESERPHRARSLDDDDGMPGWMRRRRAEDRRLDDTRSLRPSFSPREDDADPFAPRTAAEPMRPPERRPSRAVFEGGTARKKLALRVGLLAFAFVLGLGAMLVLVL